MSATTSTGGESVGRGRERGPKRPAEGATQPSADPVVAAPIAADPAVEVTQESTASETTSPWMPVGEAGSGTIHEVAEPPGPDATLSGFEPLSELESDGGAALVGTVVEDPVAQPVMVDVAVPTVAVDAELTTLEPAPDLATSPVHVEAVLAEPGLGDPAELPGLEPVVPIATALPDGSVIAGGLGDVSVAGISIDTEPDHYGVGGADETGLPTITDVTGVGGATGMVSSADGSEFGSGYLGALPGTSVGEAGWKVPTSLDEAAKLAGDAWQAVKEFPDDVADAVNAGIDKVVDTVTDVTDWVSNTRDWIEIDGSEDTGSSGSSSGSGTGTLKEFGTKYDNPEAEPILVDPSDVVAQIIATGLDPTTTTPGVVDDAEPITADDLEGAGPVGGLNVPVNPLVIDSVEESGVLVGGDLDVRFGAEGPDVIDPNDPVLGGSGGTITADDLTPPPGAANPIAGGEDEDLEDLEIQRLTPRSGASTIETTTSSDAAPATVEPLMVDAPAMAVASQELMVESPTLAMSDSGLTELFVVEPIDRAVPGGELMDVDDDLP